MPRVNCSVPMCRNRNYSVEEIKHKFFSFPKEPNRRKLWLQMIEREDMNVHDHHKICNVHFHPLMIGDRCLREFALPVLQVPSCSMFGLEKLKPSTYSTDNAAVTKGGQNRKENQAMLVDERGQQNKESEYICKGCKCNISGVRYKCVQCSDYDVCAACESRGVHALHYALRVPEHSVQDEVSRVIEAISKCLSEDLSTIKTPEVKEEVKEELDSKEGPDVEECDPLSALKEQQVPQESEREEIVIENTYTHSKQQAGAGSMDTPNAALTQLTNIAAHNYGHASILDEDPAVASKHHPHKYNITVSSTSREKRNLMLTVEEIDSCRSSKLMRTFEQLKPTAQVRSPQQKIKLYKTSLPSGERASSHNQPLKINFKKIAMSLTEPTDIETS